MKLHTLTITGIDDKVSPNLLRDFQDEYPFVEYGVLFSKTRLGTPRYPKYGTIDMFFDLDLKMSAHLCGEYPREILEKEKMGIINSLRLAYGLKRFQINYNFTKRNDWNLPNFIDWIEKRPEISVIFQANKANILAINKLEEASLPNIHFLYDSSGGRGVEIKQIKDPFPNNFTGYSGGINEENIDHILTLLIEHPSEVEVWVDLESGVRTDDKFDVDKMVKITQIFKRYM